MITVIGAHGNVRDVEIFLKKILDFSDKHQVIIQMFDADLIFGKNHLISAVQHAIRAMKNNTNTTNSLGMEILLYASGERQLKLAIPKIGVKKGGSNIAFVFVKDIIPEGLINELLGLLSLKRDDKVLEGDIDTLKRFGLNKKEINTVTKAKYEDIILEKVAMVDIIK